MATSSQTVAPSRQAIIGIPALDGLRGLAVLIVLLSHLANAGLPVLPGLSLSGIGKSGVYLFFVLSAFLLTRLLLARPPMDWRQPATWADYALRRVLRIWPLYLAVLLGSAGLTALGVALWWPYAMDGQALQRHLLLQEGMGVLWSIPVEFHYYLWLPFVAGLLALASRRGGLGAAAGLVIVLGGGALWVWPPGESTVNDVRLGPYLTLFFAGAFAAVLSLHWDAQAKAPRAGLGGAALLALIALVLTVPAVVAWLPGADFRADLNHRWFPFFAVVWSTLLLAVVHGPSGLRRLFEAAPLRWMGWVSFSAYLWHMPVLAAVTGPLGLSGLPAVLVFVAATGAVSWASWRLIERPLQGLRWPRLGASGPAPGPGAG